jgi:hypothetical protein
MNNAELTELVANLRMVASASSKFKIGYKAADAIESLMSTLSTDTVDVSIKESSVKTSQAIVHLAGGESDSCAPR